jgi:choline transport protein
MVALDCYMAAETIQAMIEVAHPTYVPVKWHGTLLTIAMALVTLAFNTLLSGHLSIYEGMFAICHFFAFAPIAATLFIMAPNRPVREVFLEFTDHGGWPHIGLSVLIGQVSNMFVVLGCDVITHMAEDIDDPATVLPRGMVWTYLINAPLTFIMALVFCFSISSIPEVLDSTSAFVAVFHASFGATPTLALSAVVLGLILMTTVGVMVSASRQVVAFA